MSFRIQAKQPTVVNLLSSPEDLTASPWYLPSVTALSNNELAPDGTYTACKFTYLSTYPQVKYDLDGIVNTGETYTLSVYVKATTPSIAITCYNAWRNFAVLSGYATVQDGENNANATLTPAPNGFYRCSYTFTVPADHTYHNTAFWLGGFNGENWTGQTYTLWGAQLVHRPNLIPAQYVNDYTDASWSKANITVTPDATTAPDGTLTADMLVATNGDPYIERWTTELTAGVTYLASVYVKAGSANSVGAQGFIWSWFQPDIPGRADGPNNYAQVLHTLTNDWQQTYIPFTPYTSGLVSFRVDTMERNWTYAPGDYTYMWGASLTVADDIPYYPQGQLNSGVRIQSRQLPGYVDRGLQFYIDAANTASNLTTAIADISGNNYSVGLHNATVTTSAFQVRNTGTAPTQCIVTQFDDGILKSTNKPGTWTLEAYWKNISPPCSNEAFIVGRIGWHGGIYCYDPGNGDTTIWHAIKTADGWTGAFSQEIASVAPGETVHSVMTYNDGWISSYINGKLIQRVQWDYNTYGMANYGNDVRIGGWDNDSFPLYGTNSDIYTIRCYSTELTAQEVAQNYQHITQQSRTDYGFRIRATVTLLYLDAGNPASYPGTGATWTDLSGNSNNATFVHPATYSADGGGSLMFNGSTSYATLGNVRAFDFGTGDFTINFWMNPFAWANGASGGIIEKKVTDGTNGWTIFNDGANSTKLTMRTNGSGGWDGGGNYISSTDVSTHIWQNWTFVRNGTTLTWYLNGVVDNTYTNIPISNLSDPTENIYIGHTNTWDGYYTGELSTIAVYTRALTPTAILQNYNATRARYGL